MTVEGNQPRRSSADIPRWDPSKRWFRRTMKTLIRKRRTALTSRRKVRLLHNNKRILTRAAQRRNEDPQHNERLQDEIAENNQEAQAQ